MLRDHLGDVARPVLDRVLDHAFWHGLRDGTLPPEALTRFVALDTGALLPAYARALSGCAATAPHPGDTRLLAQCVIGTLTSREELRASYQRLAPELGLADLPAETRVDPATRAHVSFFAAAPPFLGALGALLPMAYFHAEVADRLAADVTPGSRYAEWIAAYHPGSTYRPAVEALLALAEEATAAGSAAQRRSLVEQFSIGARYEWLFAETCLTGPEWPV